MTTLNDADQRLAEALADGQQRRPRWQHRAACRGTDVSMWFPPAGASTVAAQTICATCDVADHCLTWSLDQPNNHGIAAGMSGRQRRRLRQSHTRDAT